MPAVPKRVQERLIAGVKRYQPVLSAAKDRDLGEADTVRIVTDMLADIFGYDRYTEITSEFAIRGTYCDIATKIDGKLQCLIEVKAVGAELKDAHVRQAVDYAANQGIDWVVLTTGICWRVYKIVFAKPIDQELVFEFNFSALATKKDEDLELLFLLAKEGWTKSVLGDFHEQRQALSRYFIGAMLLTDTVLDVIRRELRRVCPDVRIESEHVRNVLVQEVVKRDVLDNPKLEEATRKINRCANRQLRARSVKDEQTAGQEGGGAIPVQATTVEQSPAPSPSQPAI